MAGKGGQSQGPKCPSCGRPFNGAEEVCVQCGFTLQKKCPKCGMLNHSTNSYCRNGACKANMNTPPPAKPVPLSIEANTSGDYGEYDGRVQVTKDDGTSAGVREVVVGKDRLQLFDLTPAATKTVPTPEGGKALLLEKGLENDPRFAPLIAAAAVKTPVMVVKTDSTGLLLLQIAFNRKHTELYFAIKGSNRDTAESRKLPLRGPQFHFQPSTPVPANPTFKQRLALLAERREQRIKYNKGL